MAEVIVMPQLGRITSEAVIREWMVDVGEHVDVGQILCEIETDKAEVEYESPFGGVVLARLEADVRVPVGEPVAIVGDKGEDISELPALYSADSPQEDPSAASHVSRAVQAPTSQGTAAVGAVSPVARKVAAELGVDLQRLSGTGPGGRITRADVLAASERTAEERVEASKMWVAIGDAMTRSANVPQFALERDVTLHALRVALEGWRTDRDEASLPTIGDAVICAVARAIRSVPNFLRSYREQGVFDVHRSVNIGIAVAIPDGLLVPVMRDADGLDAAEVARARREMQSRAHKGELSGHDVAEAIFSVSNLGPMGVHRFQPLLNPPESGIVGIGAPSPAEPEILTVTLVADHRVVNGADGAALLADIAGRLESDEGLASLAPR